MKTAGGASTVPAREKNQPTQPFFTTKPPASISKVTKDDLIDFTPELRAQAEKVIEQYKIGPDLYDTGVSAKWAGGPMGTMALAKDQGGTNWDGGSYDPGNAPSRTFIRKGRSFEFGFGGGRIEISDFRYLQGTADGGRRS